MSDHLIATARRLARATAGKPRQADVKRAVSTAYFALFDAVARNAADCLIGRGRARNTDLWVRVYRAASHADAKGEFNTLRNQSAVEAVRTLASAFIQLQDARHGADYDPSVRLTRTQALSEIERAESAIRQLNGLSVMTRKMLAVRILFRRR